MSQTPVGRGRTGDRPVDPGHGRTPPEACSARFEAAGASALGTAARAGFWLAVEQNGPWGRLAASQSHLPVEVGERLDRDCTQRGGRLSLIRRPGPHADTDHPSGRTAYLAFSGAQPWLLTATGLTLAHLLAIDLDALARGDREATARSLPDAQPSPPVLLVCTNGRRDVCCAVRGRPVAVEACLQRPGRVWEASHTGGHRFAPTGVLLPHGATLARLDEALAVEVVDRAAEGELPAGALGPRHDRGRSPLSPAAQAAESFVRHEIGETSLTALLVHPAAEGQGVEGQEAEGHEVRHRDGRVWTVVVEQRALGEDLPESCGKAPIPARQWTVRLD